MKFIYSLIGLKSQPEKNIPASSLIRSMNERPDGVAVSWTVQTWSTRYQNNVTMLMHIQLLFSVPALADQSFLSHPFHIFVVYCIRSFFIRQYNY